MIKSFRHRGLKRLFERGDKSQVQADMLDKIENILAVLGTMPIRRKRWTCPVSACTR